MLDESGTSQVHRLPKTFVDGYAGAGGLSLGLMKAGWRGLFGIEKHPFAFETLSWNLIEVDKPPKYNWPDWLEKKPHDMALFVENHQHQLRAMRQQVTLVAGGPPCQGVSLAGLRDQADERNLLFEKFLKLVEHLLPSMVLLENVQGIAIPFGDNGRANAANSDDSVADEITTVLDRMHYKVFPGQVGTAEYGVPQFRIRHIIVGVQRSVLGDVKEYCTPFEKLESLRPGFLARKQLSIEAPVSVRDAISDLEKRHGTVQSDEFPRHQEGLYGPDTSQYQKLMRVTRDGTPLSANIRPDGHRFVNHDNGTVLRFEKVMQCRRGVALSAADRNRLDIGKHGLVPLDGERACHTLTSLPDDLIHYDEPRVLTVREYARIQSFEDWFVFRGNYTTGGKKRKHDVPRYTQVANAVPPFLAEAFGLALTLFIEQFPGYSLC